VVKGHPARPFRLYTSQHQLAAWDWGDGPTVLLVHGWNGAASQLSSFVPELVKRGFYVVAFDLPAHGASDGRRTHVVDMAETLAEVGARLGPVHAVIGHSLGATATGLAISRGLSVKRAVLLSPPAEPTLFARGFASQIGLPEERVSGMLGLIESKFGFVPGALDLRRTAAGIRGSSALVMHDIGDREVPFDHGADIAEAWPGAKFVPLRGLGHRRLLRDSQVVEKAVDFIAEPRPLVKVA
jgi:pimeloyl-ACP methyl ester carboxylesterase